MSRLNQRYSKLEDDLGERPFWTTAKLGIAIVALVILIGFVGGYLAFVADWSSQPKRVFGVENVRKTWAKAYELDSTLTAQARIACRTAQTDDTADTVNGPAMLAVTTRYDTIAAEYEQLVRNKLEGGLVLPKDVPRRAPTLESKLDEIGCTQAIPKVQ